MRMGVIAAALAAVGVVVAGGLAVSTGGAVDTADTRGGIGAAVPHEHFAIADPPLLDKDDALIAYNSLGDKMARGYIASGDSTALSYRSWTRINDAPYLSAEHGNRYVNNYANVIAVRAGYGTPGVSMPPGAVIAKDSFTATHEGKLYPGALFTMEKLASGSSPATWDWRYVMIMPDGSTFGDSVADPARMEFCHACHARRVDDDALFFVPAGR